MNKLFENILLIVFTFGVVVATAAYFLTALVFRYILPIVLVLIALKLVGVI